MQYHGPVDRYEHEPDSPEVREGYLDTANADNNLVESHHEAVRSILDRLYVRVELNSGSDPPPALKHGVDDQSSGGTEGGGGGRGGAGGATSQLKGLAKDNRLRFTPA